MTAITLRHSHQTDSQLLKEINETRLLTLIARHGPLSRAEISKEAHMAKATVSEIIGRLLEADLVKEIGKGDSTSRGGKRPTMIQLQPTGRYLLGVDIKRDECRVQLSDLTGKEVDLQVINYAVGTAMDEVIGAIISVMDQLLLVHEIPQNRLLSIGISIPGLVDYVNGELWLADTLPGWDHKPIVAIFEDHFQVPCLLENDVKCMAWGERLSGAGQEINGDLICLFLGDGIGAGVIHDEHIYRGHSGGAGEIGYLEVHCPALEKGKYLRNGQKYYGELLGISSLKRALNRAGIETENRHLKDLLELDDPRINEVLDEYAEALVSLTKNLVKSFNPRTVVFTGKPISSSPYLAAKASSLLHAELAKTALHLSVDVKAGTLGRRSALVGAAALARQTLFKPIIAQYFTPDMSLDRDAVFI